MLFLPLQQEAEQIDWLAGGQLIALVYSVLFSLMLIGLYRQVALFIHF